MDRIARAREAMAAYAAKHDAGASDDEALTDLVTDLLHLAETYGHDAYDVADTCLGHVDEERSEMENH